MKKIRIIYYLMVLGFLSCQGLPYNLPGINPCDCTKPTQPSEPVPVHALTGILEIYDVEMNLVRYDDTTILLEPDSCPTLYPIKFTWSGYDQKGNVAPYGKYLVKVSAMNQCSSTVQCTELFVR
jgi:flagellar hook assembly protein FlgD